MAPPKPTKGKYSYSKQSPKKQGQSARDFMEAERKKTEAEQGGRPKQSDTPTTGVGVISDPRQVPGEPTGATVTQPKKKPVPKPSTGKYSYAKSSPKVIAAKTNTNKYDNSGSPSASRLTGSVPPKTRPYEGESGSGSASGAELTRLQESRDPNVRKAWEDKKRRILLGSDKSGTDYDQFRRRIVNKGAIKEPAPERPDEGGGQAGGASISELQRQLERRQMMEAEAKAISDKLNSMLGPVAPPPTPYGGKGFGGTAPAGGGDPGGMNMGEEELLEAAMAEGVIDPAEVTDNNKSEWLNWLLMALNPQMGFLNLGWKAMGGWEGITNPEYPFSPEYKALQEQREADRQAADDREAIRNRGLNYGAQVNQLPTDAAGQPVELTPEQELEQLLGGITDDAFLKYFNGAFGHLGTEDQLRILKGLLEARGETPAAANIEDLLANTPDRPAIQPLRKYGTSSADWRPDRRAQSNVSGT